MGEACSVTFSPFISNGVGGTRPGHAYWRSDQEFNGKRFIGQEFISPGGHATRGYRGMRFSDCTVDPPCDRIARAYIDPATGFMKYGSMIASELLCTEELVNDNLCGRNFRFEIIQGTPLSYDPPGPQGPTNCLQHMFDILDFYEFGPLVTDVGCPADPSYQCGSCCSIEKCDTVDINFSYSIKWRCSGGMLGIRFFLDIRFSTPWQFNVGHYGDMPEATIPFPAMADSPNDIQYPIIVPVQASCPSPSATNTVDDWQLWIHPA